MTKPIYKSKLFWLGVAQVALGVLEFINGQAADGATLTATGILTVTLRLVTKEATRLFPE